MRTRSTIELWECGSIHKFRIIDNGARMFVRYEGPTQCWIDVPLDDIEDVGLRVAPHLRRDLVLVGETDLLARAEMRIRQAERAQMWLALHVHAEDPIDATLARDAAASLEHCVPVGVMRAVYRQALIQRYLNANADTAQRRTSRADPGRGRVIREGVRQSGVLGS